VLSPRAGSSGRWGGGVGGAANNHGGARSCSNSRQSQNPRQTQQSLQQQLSAHPQPAAGEPGTGTLSTTNAKSRSRSKSKNKIIASDISQSSSHRQHLMDDSTASVSKARSKKKQSAASSVTRKASSSRQRLVDDHDHAVSFVSLITQSKNNKQSRSNERGGLIIQCSSDDNAEESTHNESWSKPTRAASTSRRGSTQRRFSVQDNASSASFSVRDANNNNSSSNINFDANNDEHTHTNERLNDKPKKKSKPAFPGAKFDAHGNCIFHSSMRLQERRFDKWHIFHKNCPICRSEDGNRKGKYDDAGNRGGTTKRVSRLQQPEEDDIRGRSLSKIRSMSRGVVRSISRTRGFDMNRTSPEREEGGGGGDGGDDMNENNNRTGRNSRINLSRMQSIPFNSSDNHIINNNVENSSYQSVEEDEVGSGGGNSSACSDSINDVKRKEDRGSDGSVRSNPKTRRAMFTAMISKPPPSFDDFSNYYHGDKRRSLSPRRRRDYCQSIATRSVSPPRTPGNRSSCRRGRMNSSEVSYDRRPRSLSTNVRRAPSFDSRSSFRRGERRRSYSRSPPPASSRSRSPPARDGNRKSSYSRDDGILPPPPQELRRNHSQRNDDSSPMSSRGSVNGSCRQQNRNRRSSENPTSIGRRMRRSRSPINARRRRRRDHRNSLSPSIRSTGSSRSFGSANHRMSRLEPPKRSFSKGRAMSAGRRGSNRRPPPIRSYSQLRNHERRSSSRGRPMSNGLLGGRRSRSQGPVGADSYALVVRERTPSPTHPYAPRRRVSPSRRPPMENQLVEYDFNQRRHRNSLSPSPATTRRRQQDKSFTPSKFRSQSSDSLMRRNATWGSKSPPRPSMRGRSRSPSVSEKTRSRSSTPEIWIVCPITEDDPFENSFATFEEWNLSPAPQSKHHRTPISGLTDSGKGRGEIPMDSVLAISDTSIGRLPFEFPERRNSFDLSPPTHNSMNKTQPTMKQNSSFDSFEGAKVPKRRENSLERGLPEWSDVNVQTRSKAANLSMLSQQISTMSRRDSRARSGSPERRISSILQRERQNSLERTPATPMKQSKSFNSLVGGEAPMRRENSLEQRIPESRSKAADLLVLSRQISASSRRESYTRTASKGRGKFHDRKNEDNDRVGLDSRTSVLRNSFGETQPHGERDRGLRLAEKVKADVTTSPGMSQMEMALAIIEETQGRKLPRWDTKPETKLLSQAKASSLSTSNAAPSHSFLSTSTAPSRPTTVASSSRSKSPAGLLGSQMGSVASRRRNIFSMELSSNSTRRGNVPPVQSVLPDPDEVPTESVSPLPLPSPPQRQNQQQVKPESFSTSSNKCQEPVVHVNNDWLKNQAKDEGHRQYQSKQPQCQALAVTQHDERNHQSSIKYDAERSDKEKRRSDIAGRSVSSGSRSRGERKGSMAGRNPRKQIVANERQNVRPIEQIPFNGKVSGKSVTSPGGKIVSSGDIDSSPVRKGAVGRKSTMLGREKHSKSGSNVRQNCRTVKRMPFTDQFGDTGMYTGQVNEDCRPEGKGSMKYENGVYYEGAWINGCQEENAASQYGRIRGGFTGWSGKGKEASRSGMTMPWNARRNDSFDPNQKVNVRGMEWSDISGQSGRYSGEVNKDRIPHGRGIMKYDYGLIADGRWVNGVLDEGPQDRVISAAASIGTGTGAMTLASNLSKGPMSIGPGLSVGPGMSIGPGMSLGPTISVGAGMSVGPGPVMRMQGPGIQMGHMTTVGSMPTMLPPVQFLNLNPMLTAEQHAMMTMHGGGSSMYGMGMPMTMPTPVHPPMQILLPPMQQPQQLQTDKPPVSEIHINGNTTL
jgi:hypothetical protein